MANTGDFISCTMCGLINSPGDYACARCRTPLSVHGGGQFSPAVGAPRAGKSYGLIAVVSSVVALAVLCVAGLFAYEVVPSLLTGRIIWQKAAPPGGGYEVILPGPGTSSKKPLKLPQGSVTAYFHSCDIRGQGSAVVMNVDYPEATMGLVDSEQLLVAAMNGSVTETNSTLVSHTLIKHPAGYPGIEYEMRPPTGNDLDVAIARLYWVRPRLYMLFVAGKRDSQLLKERDRFLTSLELIK